MNVVAVKSKNRITIPADLRKRMGQCESNVMEATLVQDGILLRHGDAEEDRASGRFSRARRLRQKTRAIRGGGDGGDHRGHKRMQKKAPRTR